MNISVYRDTLTKRKPQRNPMILQSSTHIVNLLTAVFKVVTSEDPPKLTDPAKSKQDNNNDNDDSTKNTVENMVAVNS